MKTTYKSHFAKPASVMVAAALSIAALASCDSAIYDDLPPCKIERKLNFISDYNLLGVDAFSKTVSSVSVAAFDQSGTAVWSYKESGDALKADGYSISLTDHGCPSGTLTFVAWCGLDNRHLGATAESFSVPDVTVGSTRIEELQCSLNRSTDPVTGDAISDKDLYPLYHGILRDVTLTDPDNLTDNTEETYTIRLMKDTNAVRVILQNLSGADLDPADFSYTVEESNGLMDYDNSLLPDDKVTYRHWQRLGGKAEVETGRSEGPNVQVAIGDLTVARLMADRKSYLTIRNDRDNRIVARVPLTDYALLVKDRYTGSMSDQEYLDRQDNYALTFFIDGNHNWMSAVIYINSWRVVLNEIEFD